MTSINRREVLGMIAAGSASMAGCLTQGMRLDRAGNPSSDDGPELLDAEIKTVDSGCAGPDDEYSEIEFSEETITVAGELPAPDPCHEAVIASADIENGRISAVLDVESTLGGDEVCMQCVGGVEYEATFEVSDVDAIEEVSIEHETGGSHTLTMEEVNEGGGTEGGGDDHIADAGDPINGHIYNYHDEALTVDVRISEVDGDVTVDDTFSVEADGSTGIGEIGVVSRSYRASVAISERECRATEHFDADGSGTLEIRLHEDGTIEMPFIPID